MRSVLLRAERDSAALVILEGLFVGDALGERFFGATDQVRETLPALLLCVRELREAECGR